MKPTPTGWPRISSSIFYEDPHAAIDFLCRAFGFELRLKVEGDAGEVVYSELTYGEGMVMVSGAGVKAASPEEWQKERRSPRAVGGANTQSLCVVVDDPDAHCARAREHGAKIAREPSTSDYGDDYWADRSYGAWDLEGHLWFFMARVREPRAKG